MFQILSPLIWKEFTLPYFSVYFSIYMYVYIYIMAANGLDWIIRLTKSICIKCNFVEQWGSNLKMARVCVGILERWLVTQQPIGRFIRLFKLTKIYHKSSYHQLPVWWMKKKHTSSCKIGLHVIHMFTYHEMQIIRHSQEPIPEEHATHPALK